MTTELQTTIKRTIDWVNVGLVLCISFIGLLFIYSATTTDTNPYSVFFTKQSMGIVLGLCIYLFFTLVDYRTLCRWGYFLYFFTIALLLFTLVKGSIGMGGQRWIDLKLFKLQPSELAKLFLPAFIVYHLHSESKTDPLKRFMFILIVLGISFVLILKQPDLGTALIIAISGFILLWYAGLSRKFILWMGIIGLLSAPIVYKCLKPYQRKRIEVFLGAGERQKERYQIEQSKIAIGSGGFWGKGFLCGTQNRLAFLPERRTDCIFAVLCEEWGFVGATILLALYTILILRIFLNIAYIKDEYTKLLALGLILPMALSIIINTGMVMGLLPVVGIPLPLMTYGLSHSFVTYAALGWVNSIITHKTQKTRLSGS